MESLREIVLGKDYFGFDLDDTLHEFKRASTKAALDIFHRVQRDYDNSSVTIHELQSSYRAILKNSTANALTDGRTSTEYRKDCFKALLSMSYLATTEEYLQNLVERYKPALKENLQLKLGALELLQLLKRLNKKVIIITEGPADAQEWTIEKLGLAPFVDILVTTSEMSIAKTEGLFAKVLKRYSIKAHEIVYIGDSMERDIVPATEVGISAILYDDVSQLVGARSCKEEIMTIDCLTTLGLALGSVAGGCAHLGTVLRFRTHTASV